MAIRITKPFTPYDEAEVTALPGHMGVFELADESGKVLYIGFAGGRSLFGLRGELMERLAMPGATQFRYEVNTTYLTRYQELLMTHIADHGGLPALNDPADADGLGRLAPS